jgi:hypothetical protein
MSVARIKQPSPLRKRRGEIMRVVNKIKREITLLEINIVCVLLFLAGTLAIVQHPNWFS